MIITMIDLLNDYKLCELFSNICANGTKSKAIDFINNFKITKCDIDYYEGYFLKKCVANNNIEMLKLLISYNANYRVDDDCVLELALFFDRREIIDYLISLGCDLDSKIHTFSYSMSNVINDLK